MDVLNVFSPLSKDYCLYFYILSIIGFVGFVLSLVVFGWFAIVSKKGWEYLFKGLFICGTYFILYFQSRLFYTMCAK